MFREIKQVRQIQGEPTRRWFTADLLELIVWLEKEDIILAFQLCYEVDGDPKALTWDSRSGFLCSGVDDGDIRFGKHKRTPVLVANGKFNKREILTLFNSKCEGLPKEYIRFVTSKIDESFTEK